MEDAELEEFPASIIYESPETAVKELADWVKKIELEKARKEEADDTS